MNKIVWKNVEYDYGVMNDLDRIYLVKGDKLYKVVDGGEVIEFGNAINVDGMAPYIDQEEMNYYAPRAS